MSTTLNIHRINCCPSDFDLCQECQGNEKAVIRTDPDGHKRTHPLLRYVRPSTRILLKAHRGYGLTLLQQLVSTIKGKDEGDQVGTSSGPLVEVVDRKKTNGPHQPGNDDAAQAVDDVGTKTAVGIDDSGIEGEGAHPEEVINKYSYSCMAQCQRNGLIGVRLVCIFCEPDCESFAL